MHIEKFSISILNPIVINQKKMEKIQSVKTIYFDRVDIRIFIKKQA